MIALSGQRYRECVGAPAKGSHEPIAADQTLLLVVGRGSRDPLAADELCRFVQLLCAQTSAAEGRACFLAMAEPSLQGMLNQLRHESWRRVVVQPHLLFGGQLLMRLNQLVHRASLESPDRQWLTTRHIGPDPLLADLIVRLACGEGDCKLPP